MSRPPRRLRRRALTPARASVSAGIMSPPLCRLYLITPPRIDDLAKFGRALGAALTLSQVGYALGMLLLVPLGDGRERRSLMVATALAASVALVATAAAPDYALLAASSLVLDGSALGSQGPCATVAVVAAAVAIRRCAASGESPSG